MMNPLGRIRFFGACAAALVVSLVSSADDIAEKGRAVYETNRAAVVTVQLTLKHQMSFGGLGSQDEEVKQESTGTVLTPDGLTLISLSETDPSGLLESIMGGMAGEAQMKMDTEVRDVKILMEDGKEMAASIILRDNTLDMAFVRPTEKPETPFTHVNLEDEAAPKLLDHVVTINRLGQVANRAHAVSLERVQAIVERPRTFYMPGNSATQTGLGSPAFTEDGEFIGVFLLRMVKSSGGGLTSMLGGGMGMENAAVVIVPAADIAEGAAQAPPFDGE